MSLKTKLPDPVGIIQFGYNPMSPPLWGMASAHVHTYVYPDVKVALKALLQGATTIKAQQLEAGTATVFSDDLYFRGQTEVTHRLLPSRLRGPKAEAIPRQRFAASDTTWIEEIRPWRKIEDSLLEVPPDILLQRDIDEQNALTKMSSHQEVKDFDLFRKRAVVKHYSDVASNLLDVTMDPEVAAFFATGASKPAPAGSIGMLWAFDINALTSLFSLKISSVPGGLKTTLNEKSESWGVNKKFLSDFGVIPTQLEFCSVQLPFKRPQAQKARFLSLSGQEGATLPPLTELTWWSIIERRAYAAAFIQDGKTYEHPDHNITSDALLFEDYAF
jgi:hypothetical protein